MYFLVVFNMCMYMNVVMKEYINYDCFFYIIYGILRFLSNAILLVFYSFLNIFLRDIER